MKYILFISLFVSLNADTYNLNTLLESLHSSHKVKALENQRDSEIAKNSLISDYEAPNLDLSISHAKEATENGVEYSVGISHEIRNPLGTKEKTKAQNNLNLAIKQEAKHEIHLLELELVCKYYSACVSQEIQKEVQNLFKEQNKRYIQLENAYRLGETSKKDLLFNKLELSKLEQKTSVYKRMASKEFFTLQTSLDNLSLDGITCDDLIAPKKELITKDINEHGELKTIAYKQNASKALYELNDSYLPSIAYELLYEKELDTQRYTAGLSIPLGTMSSKQESLKAQELLLTSSLMQQEKSLKSEIINNSHLLQEQIVSLYDELNLLEQEILPLSKELLQLAKLALDEGEGNILEYIDSSRSYSENLLDMLEVKKTYYEKLFELYKTIDKEYGEKYE